MSTSRPLGYWVVLLPLTYVLHIAEEYWAGESFFVWTTRHGWPLSEDRFVVLNLVALVAMTCGVLASLRWRQAAMILPALGTVVLINGLAHTVASLATDSYSPGLVTGLGLWVPLGVFVLRRSCLAMMPGRIAAGVVCGVVVHGLITTLAFAGRATPHPVTFSAADGAVIHADVYGSSRDTVVLAHGGQFNKDSWRPQATTLVRAGFRVMAINFRGYGESEGPGDEDVLTAPLHLDVLAAAAYLRRTGATRVSAIGASLGGWAVASGVVAEPHAFARVVFLGSTPSVAAQLLTVPKLYIMARGDTSGSGPRLPALEAHVSAAPEPKRLLVLDGQAHAQFVFATDQAEFVLKQMVDFLR